MDTEDHVGSDRKPARVVPPASGTATASLVYGILGFSLLPVIASLIAVVCGHKARRHTKPGRKTGDHQAVAGLVLGWTALVLAAPGVIVAVALLSS